MGVDTYESILSIPAYFLSLFPTSASVAKKLAATQESFSWSFGRDFKYLVRSGIIKNLMSAKGLGVRDLRLPNEAFPGPWLWRYMNEKDSIWRRVVSGKSGDNGLWMASL